MKFDGWDVIGASGVLLVSAGVWPLAGWPWALIWLGASLLALYIFGEIAPFLRRN